ncbi:hypothetical protein [Nesterenkonia sp.]|uniref:hypothetical protein n=1 Tax=Nesterenkonia sp. TaxID=704201 RepID=UPI00260B194B|nr:hypothetical protein [Nesterenkonia sp.]
MADWLQAIGTLIAAGIAIWAVCVARSANGRTDHSNRIAEDSEKHAKEANGIALDALSKSERANKIAEEANQISQEANAIAKDQELRLTDQSVVSWGVQWDTQAQALDLTNIGKDVALHVTVIIYSRHLQKTYGPIERLAGGETIKIPLPQVAEMRKKHFARAQGSGIIASSFSVACTVTVHWVTEVGNAVTGEPLELRLR